MAPKNPNNIRKRVLQALNREIEEPQLAELSAHFFHIAGGPRAVAKMLFDTFVHPTCSQMTRQRILETVLRATKFANQQSGGRDDLGVLSDEDLEREAGTLLNKFQEAGDEPNAQQEKEKEDS